MLKKVFLFTFFIGLFCNLFAQDIIVKKDGTTIMSKVLKLTDSEIEYIKWSNKNGPSYVVRVNEVLSINYENGETEILNLSNKIEDTKTNQQVTGLIEFNDVDNVVRNNKSVTIKAGTIVPLQAVRRIKAADVDKGDIVYFRVVSDILVHNNIVISRGTMVQGTVYEAKKSKWVGTKGRLVINLNNLMLPSGESVYFSNAPIRIYGKNRTPLAVVTSLFVWPCIFIPGTKAVMPEGFEVQAVVATNVDVEMN